MQTTKAMKSFVRSYRALFLAGAIFFNPGYVVYVSAEDRDATVRNENGANQSSASFDADRFGLTACNSTLLKDMKKKNVVPKRAKFGSEAAYEYQNADAMIIVPKYPNLEVARDDGRISLIHAAVMNLKAYDFTRPFYGKTLPEIEAFFKANFEGLQSVGYKVDPGRRGILLNTEAMTIEFHFNKDRVYSIDFHCASHD